MNLISEANKAFREGRYRTARGLYVDAFNLYQFQSLKKVIQVCTSKIGDKAFKDDDLSTSYSGMTWQKERFDHLSPVADYFDDSAKFLSNQVSEDSFVSVIMPVHNGSTNITEAISSVVRQKGVNFELIIIDDGSTDRTLTIIEDCIRSHDTGLIRVVPLFRNFGCYYARNIGIKVSQGNFVTFVDSDDRIDPLHLLKLLVAIERKPELVGVRSLQRRWTPNFSEAISELKPGENSFLWKKSVVDVVGYYDSVRFSADAEFRQRIEKAFGTDSVLQLAEETYFTRTRAGSLTTDPNNGIFDYIDNTLKVNKSSSRIKYHENFIRWHDSINILEGNPTNNLFIPFPLFSRPFQLGSADQNASPTLDNLRIGCMASFPPRIDSLRVVVEKLLPQLDELRIYLNGYKDVPTFLVNRKIKTYLGCNELGDIRDNGKFYDTSIESSAYIFTLDDDLEYPEDYVEKLIHHIELFERQYVVGVHGVIFPETGIKTLADRQVFYFKKQAKSRFVDLLGTGTVAWHSSTLKIDLSEFLSTGMTDVYFADYTHRHQIPLYMVEREEGWLVEIERYENSLYRESLKFENNLCDKINTGLIKRIEECKTRKLNELKVHSCYSTNVLIKAGFDRAVEKSEEESKTFLSHAGQSRIVHFHIVINGWNCASSLERCLSSIAKQKPGSYVFACTIVDDGSTDETLDRIRNSPFLPLSNVIHLQSNSGPAFARHVGISAVKSPDSVVVLVDMDDELLPNALNLVAERYLNNLSCLMTIGNWIDQNGRQNPQRFYSPNEIDGQLVRNVPEFNATHLRTFKRHLYDYIDAEDLKDEEGNWCQFCSDVALMFPLIEQCTSTQIEFIQDPIYLYHRHSPNGTLSRFGKERKRQLLEFFRGQPVKVRLSKSQVS